MKYLPLTQSQLGMFLEWNADRTSVQYNLCADSIFPAGTVDAVRLAAAVRTVLETYPVFRMRLSDRDGEIVQFVDESLAFSIEVCSAKEEGMPQVRASFRRPFDPFVEPMARAEIVVTEAATHLLTDFFHLIYDGTSEKLFIAAVTAAYEGRELHRESMTFADYAALEPSLLAGDACKTAKEEHAARFAGKTMTVPEPAETPSCGRPRTSVPEGLVRAVAQLPRTEVEAFCRAKGIHPNLFFMGAFARTLALYANTREAVFYTINHGRRDPRLRDSLGVFVKTVPVLAELRADRPLVEVLRGLKLHHAGDYPFTHFCRDLGVKPGFGYVFQDGTVRTDFTLDGVPSVTTRFSPFGVGRIPTFLVWGDANGFTLDVSVLPGDYSESWCVEFVNRIAEVARQFLAHPDALLGDVPILSGGDEKELLALGTGEKIDYDRTTTFLDLFLEHVKATPEAKAVVAANGVLTYGELDAQSSALAAALVGNGVKPGDFVAVRLGRVKEFPLSVIAIWKAGAAYVPVDPEYPEERIAYMLEDSGAKVVVDEAFLVDANVSFASGGVERSSSDAIETIASTTTTFHSSLFTFHLARPDGLAYMIYTSGSTGKPKGVMVTHANLRAFLAWLPDELGLKPGEAVAEHASFSFDASICDLYTSLSRGATLHILSSELRKDLDGLAKYLADNRIVGATLSTQLGMELLNACDLKLRYLVLGGEKLKHVKKTSVRLYNGYGPTEFTCWSSHHVVDQERDGEDIPIGRAIPNSISAIVDPTGNLLPRGMVGELVLAGAQISRGYWNRPELTAERFAALPWMERWGDIPVAPGKRMSSSMNGAAGMPPQRRKAYRTGDFARWDENGELLYCGRIDNQVKLRGFRIEMGEIEAAMAKFPGIATAVADVKKVNGVDRLVGYYTVVRVTHAHADPGGGGVLVGHEHYGEELRAFLSQSLTDYMIPDAFVRLEALPLTPNGKVDRKKLPIPEIRGAAYVAPEGMTETAIAAAMADVLNLQDPVGREDDFLSLGGDSIKSIRLVSKLRAAGVTVTVADIMKAKTVKGIAALAKSDTTFVADPSDWSGEVPLTAVQALFVRDWKLAKPGHFNQSQMLTASERLDADVLKAALEALARHHDMLRAVYAGERQRVRAAEGEGPLCELAVVEGDGAEAVGQTADRIQASFDLARGPLFKAVLFKGARADHVLFVVHHLVVDGVSWRILFEDLETAYGQLKAGAAVRLPPKTMSFRDWRAAVGRYAESAALRRELDYWRDIEAKVAAMPRTGTRSAEMREFARTLAAEPFAALRGRALEAYRTEVNDLMLTAFGRAYAAVTGDRALSVELEGHGREPLHEETQIDRTVGWFTSVYPVVVETSDDLRVSIRGVKEMLRRVPNRGLGYGILRHVAQGLLEGPEPVPSVSFNYLGTFDEGGAKGLFAIDASLPQGRTVAAGNVFGAALAVNCWGMSDGTLRILFSYDPAIWSDARTAAFADGFVRELEAVVAHTLAAVTPERTASDLGETTWSDAEFLSVEHAFASRGETLGRIYPLMPMQEGMLLQTLSEPASCTYNLAMRFALDVQPDADVLERAVERLLVKHEVLRTAIVHEGVGEPRQAIVSGRRPPVSFADLADSPDAEAESAAFARREFERPIDVQRDPLFRVVCLRTSTATCQLLVVLHHIIVDGWCISLYLRDLLAFLREELSGDARPDDFSSSCGRYERHVRDIVQRDRDAALAYWRGLLDGYETKAEIPAYEGVTEANRAASNELRFDLPAETAARLTELCRSVGCTVNNAVEAAWGLLLQRYNRTDDAVFVKVVSGRDHARENVSDVVGLFINSVPVRVRTPKEATLLDLVKAQQRQAGETSANDWMSLAEIQRESALGADLFQSILAFENYESDAENGKDAPLGLRLLAKYETNVSEIALAVFLSGDRLGVELKFDAGKYTPDEMTRLMASFKRVLCALAEMPDLKACEVPLLDPAGERELLALGTGETLDYDRTTTFLDLFASHVKATPNAKAVVAANGTLTYGELDEQSSALAAALVENGVKPGDFVAVRLGRVKEFPLSALAIWKAGAAYVPVDPEYPEERIAYMLEDSGAKVVVDETFLVDANVSFASGGVERSSSDAIETIASTTTTFHSSLFTFHLARPDGLAYMIYTSGSTGKPKGVAVTHANLRCFIEWLGRMVNIRPGDAIGEFVSFSFDGSTGDLYPSLANGATLHILSSELRRDLDGMRRYIAENRIRGMVLITSMAVELLADGEIALDYLLVGGERVVPFRPIPTLDFYNVYGPTEFTNMSVTGLVDQTFPDNAIPIGRPVPGTLCAVVDPAGNLVPRGMVGELVLAGPQLSRGYWHRPELTAERFVALPWMERWGGIPAAPGKRCVSSMNGAAGMPPQRRKAYRTGDLCRWRADGRLDYCGRIDNQVKLRGFRIEMGEIEAAMAKFPGIAAAVADVKKVNGVDRLVGYYVETAAPTRETELRAFLSQSLADYMVPDAFVRLEALPLTPNGKVDRKRLPVPEIKADEIVAPATDREKAFFAIVAEQLGTEAFGVTTNLIAMGLTSLRAIRLSAAIRKATGFVVPTGEILAKPRIRDWTALGETEAETIAVLPSRETYPLTANQLGVYLDWARNRAGLQYNVPSALRFAGTDAAKLRDAVAKAVAAHPYFKVHLEERDGTVVQVRRDEAVLEVSLARLDHEPDAAFFQSRIRPFDLLGDDLARFEVYAAPEAAYLFFDVHHILFDGGSANVLLSAIRTAWAGDDPAPEAVSAYDYALHDAAWQSSEAFVKAEAYFDGLIAGTESFLYPSVRSGATASGAVATLGTRVPRAAIRTTCRASGVTENAFFATAFCETLRRVARTDDIQIATVSNGRSLAQLANSIGMFVETLPLVSRREKGSAAEAIRAMQTQIAETIRHDRYPFTKLVERHGLKPNVLYVYQGDVVEDPAVDLNLRPQSLPLALDTAKVPLALNVLPKDDAYELVFEYDIGLYGSEEIGTLADALKGLLESLATQGGRNAAPTGEATFLSPHLCDVPIVSDHEARELLTLGTGEKIDYDRTTTFVDLFASHVKATPEAKAVVAANGTLTYGELDAQSSALAAALVGNGVKPGDFVAVRLGRVKEFPLSALAIWKAGAAYVPVDPEYPAERIAYMLEDSGAKVVVDEAFLVDANVSFASGGVERSSADAIETIASTTTTFHSSLFTVHLARPDGLAYMIYTSGSTGKPKGVMVTHANLRAFLAWRIGMTGAKPGEAFAHYTSFSFDASLDDLVTPLAAGATLHILSEKIRLDMEGLRRYLADNAIVGLTLPTQFGMQLLNDGAPESLRYLMMGGEKLKTTKASSVRIVNGYGPTEFTVCSSYHRVDPAKDGDDIPIGRPVPNSLSAIVDRAGNLLPRGMVGELVLAGDQLTKGYWNRPELTAERFVALPWMERWGDIPVAPGKRMSSSMNGAAGMPPQRRKAYRTGDLARWNGNGELVYCGRIDNLVKLRGFRIEMGEIEAAMAKFPGIAAAVADVKKVNGVDRLVGYYVETAAPTRETELRAFLSQSLAEYMIPDAFVRLEALPMTPNGKVDRKALPVPAADAIGGDYVAPTTVEERALCAAYGRILKLARYGAETDFFLAGGSSLDGIRLVAELQRLGFKVVYGDLFKHKTPRKLAAFLAEEAEPSAPGPQSPTFAPDAYDYAAIDALLAQTPSEPNDGVAAYALKRVLLTGVTGYLGIHVLKQLLESSDCRVAVLVRPKRGLTVAERVASQYFYYFERTLPEAAKDRLAFVEGDITDADLAGKLADVRFDTLFNCAALVKHYVADDQLDRVNVEGVRNLVNVCAAHEARLIQMSTASVGGVAARGTVLDERHLYVGQTTYNDYVRTKYEAERLVLEAIASGRIRGKVMRLGNLMGREADGVFQMNFRANAFINAIRTFARLGAVSLADAALRTEFSQIDLVAEAVVKLSVTPDSMVVFHPFSPYKQDLGSVIDAVNVLGQRIDFVSKSEFASRVEAMRNDPARAKDLQGLLHYGQRGPDDRRPVEAVNDWTTVVLRRLGFLWKPPAEGYLETFFRFLDGLQFFGD